MKKLLAFLFFTTLLISCEKEDNDCVLESFEKTIVGSWKGKIALVNETGDITFNADGTGSGTGIFEVETNGTVVNDFKWVYSESDDELSLDYRNVGGTSIDPIYTVDSYHCNEVRLNLLFDITLTRK